MSNIKEVSVNGFRYLVDGLTKKFIPKCDYEKNSDIINWNPFSLFTANEQKQVNDQFNYERDRLATFHLKTFVRKYKDLFGVGLQKPIGYLPLQYLKTKENTKEIINWAENNGLEYKRYEEKECHIGSGCLYVFHRSALQMLLLEYESILKNAGVPVVVNDFIDYISTQIVYQEKYPKAYIVVGLAFADKRFKKEQTK